MTKDEALLRLQELSNLGCSDGSCFFRNNRIGMHTNGGCHCYLDGIGRMSAHKFYIIIDELKEISRTLYKDKEI
jgi:hypothetical protein